MSNLINKWNKTKDDIVKKEEELKAKTELLLIRETKQKWKDKYEAVFIRYRDKTSVHKKS